MAANRLLEDLFRDLYVFEDENNPSSLVTRIYPPTVLDQVFDQLSPTRKTLREILADLRQEIISGGIGNIVFPVTSVNGKTADVILNKNDIGLGRADNTRDVDKPLSTPQRIAIFEILNSFDFNLDLSQLYNHLADTNNPHKVTIDQLDYEGDITKLIDTRIGFHNLRITTDTHPDIRRLMTTLWDRVDEIDFGIEKRVNSFLEMLNYHLTDLLAHDELMQTKENIIRKVPDFTLTVNNNHSLYPTTRAVSDFVTRQINAYDDTHKVPESWISDIGVVNSVSELPAPSAVSYRRAFIITYGPEDDVQNSLAVCRINPQGDYFWDIHTTRAFSKLHPDHFIRTTDGITLNLPKILATIPHIDSLFADIIFGDGTPGSGSIKDKFLTAIKILPGTMDGNIRYYINNDLTTMSDEIRIPGLQTLAFKEWITEFEIREQAVHERHILSKAVTTRCLADNCVTPDQMTAIPISKLSISKGHLIGNLTNDDGTTHEIGLITLGDMLRPIIGGWPDPNVPGSGPPVISSAIAPHTWEAGVPYAFPDGSFGMRFIGTISVIPNDMITKTLVPAPTTLPVNSRYNRLVGTGGAWCTDSTTRNWSGLGGSNITGHTFADVSMDQNGITLGSVSIGNRVNAPYDVWIRYVPMEADPWLTGQWYDDPELYTPLIPETTPNAAINFVLEQITGLVVNAVYVVNDVELTAGASGNIQIQPYWFNSTIEIVRRGNDSTSGNSRTQFLYIPPRPFAPALTVTHTTDGFTHNGRINGTTSAMEFKPATALLWTDAAYNVTNYLAPITYHVRYKAVFGTAFASDIYIADIH